MMLCVRMRSPLARSGAVKAAAASIAIRAAAARLFSSVVDSAWVRSGGDGAKKLLILDCEQETAFRRAHIPGALPFLIAPSGLKVPYYALTVLGPLVVAAW